MAFMSSRRMSLPRSSSVIVLVLRCRGPAARSALERGDATRHRVDALQTRDDAPPRAHVLCRNAAGVYAGLGDRMTHHREPGDGHVVANGEMADEADHAANLAAFADDDAAREADAGGHGGVRPDAAVVPDLDLVIELHALLEHGVGDGPAVDGRVRADLAVGADDDTPDLRHFEPAFPFAHVAEPIAADHRAGLDDDACAELHVMTHGDARDEMHVFGDLDALLDHAVRADDGARADYSAGADRNECPDVRGRIDARIRRNG